MYRKGVPSLEQGTSAFIMYPNSSELLTLAAIVSSLSPLAVDSKPLDERGGMGGCGNGSVTIAGVWYYM